MRGRSSMLVDRRASFGRRKLCGDNHDFAADSFVRSRQFADTDRHNWLRQYRRNDRRLVGQERTSVFFSSRHPDELKDMVAKLGSLAQAGTVEQAIAFGDVLFIAVPYGAIPQIGKDYSAAMKGKVMLDACNAVSSRDGAVADEVEQNGIGVTTQKYFPGVRIVRAFNTMSYMVFAREANRPDPKLAIPIAGDDPQALQIAARLVRDAGFDPVTVGNACRCAALSARSSGIWTASHGG